MKMAKIYFIDNQQLAEKIRNSSTWDYDDLTELCRRAELESEWENADGEKFESIAYRAAKILGVEI